MAAIQTWPGWECVRQLGSGSYGKVYEIKRVENGFERRAALKVISIPESPDAIGEIYEAGYANTEEEASTYLTSQIDAIYQEYRLMAELRGSDNIVEVEDCLVIPHDGWSGSDILIRMELLTPLNQYLAEHSLSEPEIIRIGIDVCRALEVCQMKEPPILHRDIKTANIMRTEKGQFKLGDFGVARAAEGARSAHTKAGTEDYMAPEVMRSGSYFAAADIYSLGMVLYRLLNNNRGPYLPIDGYLTADMVMAAKERRLSGEPLPEPEKGNQRLKKAVLRALEFEPEKRYQTATEFRWELERCRADDKPYDDASTYRMFYNKSGAPAEAAGETTGGFQQKKKKPEMPKAPEPVRETEPGSIPHAEPTFSANTSTSLLQNKVVLALIAAVVVLAAVVLVFIVKGRKGQESVAPPPAEEAAEPAAPTDTPADINEESGVTILDEEALKAFLDPELFLTGSSGSMVYHGFDMHGVKPPYCYLSPNKSKGIAVGETLNVALMLYPDAPYESVGEYLEKEFGVKPEVIEFSYAVEGPTDSVHSVDEIPADVLDLMITSARKQYFDKAASWDASESADSYSYIGCILLCARDNIVTEHNNVINLVFEAKISADGESKTLYRVVEYDFVLRDREGKVFVDVGTYKDDFPGDLPSIGKHDGYFGYLTLDKVYQDRISGVSERWIADTDIAF